jgi:hypothetical protein
MDTLLHNPVALILAALALVAVGIVIARAAARRAPGPLEAAVEEDGLQVVLRGLKMLTDNSGDEQLIEAASKRIAARKQLAQHAATLVNGLVTGPQPPAQG